MSSQFQKVSYLGCEDATTYLQTIFSSFTEAAFFIQKGFQILDTLSQSLVVLHQVGISLVCSVQLQFQLGDVHFVAFLQSGEFGLVFDFHIGDGRGQLFNGSGGALSAFPENEIDIVDGNE